MREIKFRAWLKKEKKMVNVVEIDFIGDEIIWVENDDYMKLQNAHYEDFADIELMQFTGLHDKNGVEIYEGDIVDMHYFYESGSMEGATESEDNVIGVVGIDIIGTHTETEDEKHYWLIYLQEPEEELEVLTNIHDNPEFLYE